MLFPMLVAHENMLRVKAPRYSRGKLAGLLRHFSANNALFEDDQTAHNSFASAKIPRPTEFAGS